MKLEKENLAEKIPIQCALTYYIVFLLLSVTSNIAVSQILGRFLPLLRKTASLQASSSENIFSRKSKTNLPRATCHKEEI
jgi:hypothetical protein